jgi:hypothetical protein
MKSIVKVETFKGYASYTREEIEEFLSEVQTYMEADNLPKWLLVAVMYDLHKHNFTPKVIHTVESILLDILDGKIPKIDFKRDSKRNIIGLKTPDITQVLESM